MRKVAQFVFDKGIQVVNGDISEVVACNIKRFRKKRRLSQMALAEKCGLHFTYISQIERGIRRNVSLRTVKAICDVLGIGLDQVVSAD